MINNFLFSRLGVLRHDPISFFNYYTVGFVFALLEKIYPFSFDKKVTIKGSVLGISSYSVWVIAVTFALLVSILAGGVAELTCFSVDDSCELIISDNILFLFFSLFFICLLIFYMRLMSNMKKFEVYADINKNAFASSRNSNYSLFFRATEEFRLEYKKFFWWRLILSFFFLILYLFMGSGFGFKVDGYILHSEMGFFSLLVILTIFAVFELAPLSAYIYVSSLFGGKPGSGFQIMRKMG